MIKLTLLIPTLDRSGAEKQLTLLAAGLPRDEFQTEVIALDRGGPYADTLQAAGIPVTVIGKRGKCDVRAWRILRRHLHSTRPDILHTWLFAANAYGRLAVDHRRTRTIVSERCVDSWKSAWQLAIDRLLAPRTDRLVANSASVAQFYREQGVHTPAVVIPNGVELPTGARLSRAQLVAELQLPEDARLVCYVGRLARQKRVDDLLWSAQLLRQVEPRAYFLIVGDGPERERLIQHAKDVECIEHVRFLGHRPDAADVAAVCDVFWLGSSFEGMSNSLLEALARGRPVVVSNIPPNREIVQHGVHGYLVDIGDGAGFAQYTLRILNDSELAGRLSEAGRELVRQRFSVEAMVDSHVRLYREVLGQEASRASRNPVSVGSA